LAFPDAHQPLDRPVPPQEPLNLTQVGLEVLELVFGLRVSIMRVGASP